MSDPDIKNNINNYYSNLSYSEEYSNDIWLTIIIIILTIAILLYFYITNNLQTFKRDWSKYQCNPFFMPFAAIINPQPDQSPMEYTSKNFSQCMDKKNYEIGLIVQKPINSAMDSIFGLFNFFTDMVEEIQGFVLFIFELLIRLYEFIISKIKRIIDEISHIFISVSNLFGNILAFFTTIYWMLVLFISSLKLLFAAAAMGFLLGLVIPSIIITVKLWTLTVISFFVWIANTPWPWFVPLQLLWIILLILAVISTIMMIILLVVYSILCKFVEEVLKETTPYAPTSSEVPENTVNDGD